VTAAQGPSHPSTSQTLEIARGKQPAVPYPWERSTFQTHDLLSAEEGNVIVNTVEAWSNGDDIDPLPDNNTFELPIAILPGNYYVYLPVILRNH
jgi:hypothetical protein